MTITELKRGEPCVLKWCGRYLRDAKVLQVYPEAKNAVRVERKELDYVVKRDEVLTMDEWEDQQRRDIAERNEREYGDIRTAWKAGKRTNKELADATNTPINGIASRIRAAKRRGMLE